MWQVSRQMLSQGHYSRWEGRFSGAYLQQGIWLMYERLYAPRPAVLFHGPAGSNGTPCIIDGSVSAHWPTGLEVLGLFSQQEAGGGGTWPLTYVPLTLFHLIVYNTKRIWIFFHLFFFLHMINWVRLPQTSLMRVTHEMHEICPWNTLIFSHACECVLTANVHRKGKKGIHTIISLFFLQLAPTGKKTKNKKRSGGRAKLGAFLKERIRLGK